MTQENLSYYVNAHANVWQNRPRPFRTVQGSVATDLRRGEKYYNTVDFWRNCLQK